jgi:hypothetical protein
MRNLDSLDDLAAAFQLVQGVTRRGAEWRRHARILRSAAHPGLAALSARARPPHGLQQTQHLDNDEGTKAPAFPREPELLRTDRSTTCAGARVASCPLAAPDPPAY